MRKRDKAIASNGQAPKVDLETLRAATRAAGSSGNSVTDKDSGLHSRPKNLPVQSSMSGDASRDESNGAGSGNNNDTRQISQSSSVAPPPPQQTPPTGMMTHYGFTDSEMSVVPPTHSHPHGHPQQSPPAMQPTGSSWTSLPPRGYSTTEASSFVRASHARSSGN